LQTLAEDSSLLLSNSRFIITSIKEYLPPLKKMLYPLYQMAGDVNVQGEDVMRMDQIAQEITINYLRASGRVIHAVSEESEEIISINPEGGRYFVYFDPLDGSSNIPHGLPVGFLFGIAKRNLEGPEDGHLRAGKDYIAAGMFVIPTGTFTLGLKEAGTWRFHIDETMTFVRRPG
jgi:fructose-1,6-bisphosphatase I